MQLQYYCADLRCGGRLAWSRTAACHAADPGSNPGHRTNSSFQNSTSPSHHYSMTVVNNSASSSSSSKGKGGSNNNDSDNSSKGNSNNNNNCSKNNSSNSSISTPIRDIYAREERLKHWLGKVEEELQGEDREDIMGYVQHHLEKETSALCLIRCINSLITLRRYINKPFRYAQMRIYRILYAG